MSYVKILSHRGANKEAPENTLAAFSLGLERGADGIELDVQLSKDGEIMVIHDEKLDRTTDMQGYVCSYTCGELKNASAGALFADKYADERIPTLREVFELLKGSGKILNIELKTGLFFYEGIERKVIDMIKEYNYQELSIISSFNHYSLAICKTIAPEIKTGILYSNWLYEAWNYAKTVGADALHPSFNTILHANEEQMKHYQSSGLQINPYTVNNESDISAMIKRGVTSIITDYPERVVEIRKCLCETTR